VNRTKLAELIVYIVRQCENHPEFNKHMLNELLARADAEADAELGHSITGAWYEELPTGRAPFGLDGVLAELLAAKRLRKISGRCGPYGQPSLVLGRKAREVDPPSAEERAIADHVIESYVAHPR
jgi:hypothetical protein